ncbi:MAG: hypothetical protein ABIG44_04505 [Planctomycetota bacterium]
MRLKGLRILAAAVGGVMLLMAGGCVIAADALNPAFFSGLGFDPNTIFPPSGTIIVTFTNNTNAPATFYAFESADAVDLVADSRNFSVEVQPGETRNEVLTCPVGMFSPGILGADLSIDNTAADVQATGGAGTATYDGVPLVEDTDFSCGDVIDVQLYIVGAVDSGAYLVTVRLIPGG